MSKDNSNRNHKENTAAAIGVTDVENISKGVNGVKGYNEMGKNLSKLNTGRGGDNFKGFVFEELHAADATASGQVTKVLNNNGPADFNIKTVKGGTIKAQAKTGYKTRKAGFADNKCKTAVVDKGNTKLIKEANDAGKRVIESNISDAEAKALAKAMKLESKITHSKEAVAVSNMAATAKAAKEIHKAGVSNAGKGGVSGGAFSLGSNIVEVVSGDKSVEDAAVDVAKDAVTSAAMGYGIGAAATAIGSTAAGAAVTTAAATAGAAVTTAVGSTAIGAAALGTAASVGATAAAGAAAISTGTAAVLGTAVAGTAIGAAAVAAAPIVVTGVVIGAVATGIGKLFKRR